MKIEITNKTGNGHATVLKFDGEEPKDVISINLDFDVDGPVIAIVKYIVRDIEIITEVEDENIDTNEPS